MMEFYLDYFWAILAAVCAAAAALGFYQSRNPDNFLRRLSGALFPPADKSNRRP